ncbi:MAG: metallophosphoesterase family protein [Bacteroidales bacterium]|jgi:putative phosphoesterase|nr:metallophosphoesterase family protein [Bacteroidales bacterium]
MKRIGLLSDTHGFLHPKLENFFKDCDEIWHAGDIGSLIVSDTIGVQKYLRAVHGNIDDHRVRIEFPAVQFFECEGLKVLMMHIGGYPGNYSPEAKEAIQKYKPGLFIAGHSHILKVIYDKKNDLLHMNPGAAGTAGIHHLITALRFTIDDGKPTALEILEIPR